MPGFLDRMLRRLLPPAFQLVLIALVTWVLLVGPAGWMLSQPTFVAQDAAAMNPKWWFLLVVWLPVAVVLALAAWALRRWIRSRGDGPAIPITAPTDARSVGLFLGFFGAPALFLWACHLVAPNEYQGVGAIALIYVAPLGALLGGFLGSRLSRRIRKG